MIDRHAEILAEAKRLQQAGRLEESATAYRQAVELEPDYAEAWNNLGNVLRALSRLDEATACLRRASKLRPDLAGIHSNLGLVLGDLGRFEEAAAAHRRAVELKPDLAPAHNNLGVALKELTRFEEAVACYRRAIDLVPGFAEAHSNLGNALRALKRTNEAVASYRQALALKPDYAEGHNNLGNALRDLKRPDEAVACCQRAADLAPGRADIHDNLGRALQEAGKLPEARRAFEQAIALDPLLVGAYFNLAAIRRTRPGDDFLARLEARVRDAPASTADDRMSLLFALAKAYEDAGRYDEAFAALSEANRRQRACVDYDEAASRSRFERIARTFTRELIADKADLGSESQLPIFIVGFPRSGTTLAEQILASHPQVHGAGELDILPEIVATLPQFPECVPHFTAADLRALGDSYVTQLRASHPAMPRITDKRPENHLLAGLIHLTLPRAKILHIRRNAIDTCVSCFSLPLSGGFTCRGELGELGRFYGMYARLMEHWRDILPAGAMLEIRYEDLVADLAGQTRRILDHCGLPWDDRCLAFDKAERPVSTPSLAQVRQPIYRSSVQRWRRYEKHLGPLIEALGPYAEEAATGY